MLRKYGWILLSCLIALSLVLAACTTTTEEEEEEEEQPPTGGNWWDYHGEPEYGGTLTMRRPADFATVDPNLGYGGAFQYFLECLWMPDWLTDRADWDFKVAFNPWYCNQGNLAESWEMPDPYTLNIKLREGVHWQNKAPANGREFTADDVQAHFARTKVAPFHRARQAIIDGVEATGKYNVTMKFNV